MTETIKMIDLNGAIIDVPTGRLQEKLLQKGWQLAVVVKEQPIKPQPPTEVRDFLASQQKCCERECKKEITPEAPPEVKEPEVVKEPEIIEPAKPKEVRKVIKRKRK